MKALGLASVLLFLSAAACHDKAQEGPPRGAHAAVVRPECDVVPVDGAPVLFYDGVGALGFKPGYAPRHCPSVGLCGPATASAGDCVLDPKSDVSITGMRPDGIVGTVRRFDLGAAGCRDGLNVWIPREDFAIDEGFHLAADFFAAPHCDR